jgi:hypothetical protein
MTRPHFCLTAILALMAVIADPSWAAPTQPNDPVTIGEPATLAIAPTLRRHVVLIGRVSSGNYQPGVLVSKEGYILTAPAPSLDPEITPYLVLFPDGHRVVPEVVREDKDNGLVLLKSPEIPAGLVPAPIAAIGDAKWFLAGAWSPSPRPGEIPRIDLGRLIREPKETNGPLVLDLPLRVPGSPIFDLAGRLVAIGRKPAPNRYACTCVPVAGIVNSWPGLPTALVPGKPPAPAPLEITEKDRKGTAVREKQLLPNLSEPVPVVTVRQGDRTVALGTIVSDDGLILTKASELGDALSCQLGEHAWPAALLAVDEETDLALLRVDARHLPIVSWHNAVPEAGAWLYSPCPPDENDPMPFSCGLLSHRSAVPRGHTSLDQPEFITSLGIVLEQADSALVVAALVGPEQEGGFRRGDCVTCIGGRSVSTRADLIAELAARRVGQHVEVDVLRDGKPAKVSMALAPALPWQAPNGGDNDILSNFASARRSGFADVLCHDGVLDAVHCGGPVTDSKGRFIGLNIARADKGATLALTVPAIQAAYKRLLSKTESF